MYRLTDEQIEYILDDIRRGGIGLEDLQYNLLDHICCILERDLKETDDFEGVYRRTVRQFYDRELGEIERQTIHLSNTKNHYTMKKIMLASGILSAAAFIVGSIFKIFQMPGTIVFMFVAMALMGLVFLPLMGITRASEKSTIPEKLVPLAAALTGSLFIFSNFFALMQWQGRTSLWLLTTGAALFLLAPSYLYAGWQRADRQTTVLNTIVLVGFASALFFMIRIH
ncbi:MAG: hypothetical protein JST83_08780 [Bacteroidetes bacterium]|nr:hypothetical protein [Bacteroidota bacterium]